MFLGGGLIRMSPTPAPALAPGGNLGLGGDIPRNLTGGAIWPPNMNIGLSGGRALGPWPAGNGGRPPAIKDTGTTETGVEVGFSCSNSLLLSSSEFWSFAAVELGTFNDFEISKFDFWASNLLANRALWSVIFCSFFRSSVYWSEAMDVVTVVDDELENIDDVGWVVAVETAFEYGDASDLR